MKLPLRPGFAPMEAKAVGKIPQGDEWQYEPKWDGFRCIVFRDGPEVDLRSRSGQPLARYFPDLVEAVTALGARRFVLDGEIIVRRGARGALSFDDLLQRIHPAPSRIARLAGETPATLLVFDLLVDERRTDLTGRPLKERRARLERFATRYLAASTRIKLSPMSLREADARRWLQGRAGTDGVVAKRRDLEYRSGDRTGMQKVKRLRTADCVVGGYRYASSGGVIGSLLLGLYDADGLLHHVGFTSSLSAAERRRVTPELERITPGKGFTGRAPGGPSRWSTERSAAWRAVQPRLVVEVQYDHFSGDRFRHGTKFLRWRPDKSVRACTFEQIGR